MTEFQVRMRLLKPPLAGLKAVASVEFPMGIALEQINIYESETDAAPVVKFPVTGSRGPVRPAVKFTDKELRARVTQEILRVYRQEQQADRGAALLQRTI